MSVRPNKQLSRPLLGCMVAAISFAQSSLSSDQFTTDFDSLWSTLRNGYAYFGKKQTDWNRVREIYRPAAANIKSRVEFVPLLERVLDELYDDHLSPNANLKTSGRLVPSGADLWPEWNQGRAIITQVRTGFSAEQSGLKAGMEIVSVNDVPINEAVLRRLPRSLRTIDDEVRNWALRRVLAGTHDQQRVIQAKDRAGVIEVYRLDLPTHRTVDTYRIAPTVEWKMLPEQVAYIKLNDLISQEIVSQFDRALESVRTARGLILDLRDIPQGGSTDVAEPLLGRFISRQMGYQEVVPLNMPTYIKQVAPRGEWTYRAPLVALVNRWTGSMAEGMAIGLDGMHRATIVGTPMAGLNGGVFVAELTNSRIAFNYPGERLNHLNGTPRENFVPPVVINLLDTKWDSVKDPILEAGYKRLMRGRPMRQRGRW